jgi:hypothetical protein
MEMSKDELCISAIIRHNENRDNNDDGGGLSPVNAYLVDQVKIFGTEDIDVESN